MDRRSVAVAAVVLLAGWGFLLASPLVQADAVEWSLGLSWHVQCQTVVFPFRGEPHCVAELGALGVATALAGVAAGASALMALRQGSDAALAFAHRSAVVAGAVLALGVVWGVARHFSGLGEVPFDVAALAFAAWPAVKFGEARRDRGGLRHPEGGASPVPP